MGRLYRWLRPDERRLIAARLAAGASMAELAREFGYSRMTIARVRDEASMLGRRAGHSPRWLSFEERERILVGVSRGESDAEIARALGRHRSTIGREIKRTCLERWRYRPSAAERRRAQRAQRPKPGKLASNPRLLAAVERGLLDRWSPEQISARLKREYPNDRGMRISHETIYRALYVQSRGELRRQLTKQLRTGRDRRKPQGQVQRGARIADMVSISERPPEVEDRAVPGHWEGDLLVGARNQSFVATLVERHTRYVMLAGLGRDRRTEHVVGALRAQIQTLPSHLTLSLTWDQGTSLPPTRHSRSRPESRSISPILARHGSEGPTRTPTGCSGSTCRRAAIWPPPDQLELDEIARQLNGRPRKTLDWMTPAEKMDELLAASPRPSSA
jgi:IS30 family transposase